MPSKRPRGAPLTGANCSTALEGDPGFPRKDGGHENRLPPEPFPLSVLCTKGEIAGTLFFSFLFLSALGFFFSRVLRN
jgi:hypothetical protein